MFSLFNATRAMLPGGSCNKAVEIGSIGARREVWSVTGCPSRSEPGTGNCMIGTPCAAAMPSTIWCVRVVWLVKICVNVTPRSVWTNKSTLWCPAAVNGMVGWEPSASACRTIRMEIGWVWASAGLTPQQCAVITTSVAAMRFLETRLKMHINTSSFSMTAQPNNRITGTFSPIQAYGQLFFLIILF